MTDVAVRKITNITGADKKMLVINDKFYCMFADGNKEIFNPDPNYCFWTCSWKEQSCPALVQYADVYIYDVTLSKAKHESGFGKLYHYTHLDMDDSNINKHTFVLHFADNSIVNCVGDVEVFDAPFSIKKFLRLIKYRPTSEVLEPIHTLGGLTFVDFGTWNGRSASIEYDLDGKLYFEVVDWNGAADMEFVPIDSTRRKVIVNYETIDNHNAVDIAEKIERVLDELSGAHNKEGIEDR